MALKGFAGFDFLDHPFHPETVDNFYNPGGHSQNNIPIGRYYDPVTNPYDRCFNIFNSGFHVVAWDHFLDAAQTTASINFDLFPQASDHSGNIPITTDIAHFGSGTGNNYPSFQRKVILTMKQDGSFEFWRGYSPYQGGGDWGGPSVQLGYTAAGLAVANTWMNIDLKIEFLTNTITLLVNSVPVTVNMLDTVGASCDRLGYTFGAFSFDGWNIDNFQWHQGSGTYGPNVVRTLWPLTDYAVQFTPKSGTVNHVQVDDQAATDTELHDGDATYVQSDITDAQDLYGLESIFTTFPIRAFQINVACRMVNPAQDGAVQLIYRDEDGVLHEGDVQTVLGGFTRGDSPAGQYWMVYKHLHDGDITLADFLQYKFGFRNKSSMGFALRVSQIVVEILLPSASSIRFIYRNRILNKP